MMTEFQIPIIDISAFTTPEKFGDDLIEKKRVTALKIGTACKEVGFFTVVGHGISNDIINSVWKSTSEFFDLPLEEKQNYVKPQNVYPFGYSPIGAEVLSNGKKAESQRCENAIVQSVAPDMKELFSLGPDDPATNFPPRIFPCNPSNFAASWTTYYDELNKLANLILEAFSIALGLGEGYFEKFVTHHASALRAINYPAIDPSALLPHQLRASAHTDYGTVTILRSDGPGLQVSKDKDPPCWRDVPFIEDGFIINLGDLMRRWTNDEWLSTLHRVVVTAGPEGPGCRRRQSLAFFHNINRDAVVEALLLRPDDKPKYDPIVAGDFLMQKHLASLGETKT
mmetsp:Transcript_10068/g.13816  ORF Transcript_10068/g.13816 Transcript_10068/m.13816 type:complete len:340 (-) Transcript_10068:1805-2824(-)